MLSQRVRIWNYLHRLCFSISAYYGSHRKSAKINFYDGGMDSTHKKVTGLYWELSRMLQLWVHAGNTQIRGKLQIEGRLDDEDETEVDKLVS